MGKRKGGNKGPASPNQKATSDASMDDAATQTSAAVVEEDKAESSNLEEPMEVMPLIGGDQTSADYYFDSYSHFGGFSLELDFSRLESCDFYCALVFNSGVGFSDSDVSTNELCFSVFVFIFIFIFFGDLGLRLKVVAFVLNHLWRFLAFI